MTKTSAKTADTVEFQTFDADKAADQFRAFAEKGVEQSKEAYARLKANAEQTQKAFENTFENAKAHGNEFSLKAISVARANTEAGFAHLEAVLGAKSLSELMELQTSFIRRSFETAVEQSKDLQAVSTRAAEDMSKPFKDAFEKGAKELKVA